MKIKIDKKNKEKLENLLDEVQGKAYTRIVTFEYLMYVVSQLDKKMAMMYLHDKKGVRYHEHANDTDTSYKWDVNTTHITLERGTKDWFLIDVDRVETACGSQNMEYFVISEEQKESLFKEFLKKHEIIVR